MATATYTLLGPDGRPYPSSLPGSWGGHRRSRIYGRLDCPTALLAIARGGYVAHRVFFADEDTAVAAGYRPCGACCPDRYLVWKQRRDRRVEVVPGAVHVPGWLDLPAQARLVAHFHRWAAGPVPIRAAKVRGHEMSVRTVCLGWHWQPYRYSRTADDVNDARVLPLPDWLADLGRRALADAGWSPSEAARYRPDAALVNFYDATARLGMHQDKDERSPAPVVSFSIGDDCTFRFGNTEHRGRPYDDLRLRSGDLFVFGGPARLAHHGVPRIHPGTAPEGCGLEHGRINITLRVTGLLG
ncbi:alpha-ketoglutarate-dependent dioxygenase AlkB [Pimelobacter simplex]|uniref:alpha-ketoglutarate-dependent dioxygenase AlkB n=1 Tax=Nocardioides simplex TaxID=2045 RepID=UPI003AAEBA9F